MNIKLMLKLLFLVVGFSAGNGSAMDVDPQDMVSGEDKQQKAPPSKRRKGEEGAVTSFEKEAAEHSDDEEKVRKEPLGRAEKADLRRGRQARRRRMVSLQKTYVRVSEAAAKRVSLVEQGATGEQLEIPVAVLVEHRAMIGDLAKLLADASVNSAATTPQVSPEGVRVFRGLPGVPRLCLYERVTVEKGEDEFYN